MRYALSSHLVFISCSQPTFELHRCDGATYPARLVNLPCPVEVHKTVDHAAYHKSADVGQMLLVYEDEYAMQEAEAEKPVEGFPSYYHSGLTPPMKRVVKRRFLSRMEERDVKPIPPKRGEVRDVEAEIKKLIEKLSDKKQPKAKSKPTPKDRIIEEIEEEIVDYEPWMGEGGTFTLEDAKLHPEWWLSKSEIKEIEDAKQETMRKEREEQEAKLAAAEAAAEKKAKKKEKKKKKKLEEEEAKQQAAAAAANNKNTTPLANNEEIDEVTAAAMTISQGIDNEELLLDDDMFDFENEDITDLF